MTKIDHDAVRELVLFTDNDGALYESVKLPVVRRLAKMMARSSFDRALALRSFERIAEAGARKYAWELGDRKRGSSSWVQQSVSGNGLFPPAVRRAAAEELLENSLEAIDFEARKLTAA